MAEAKSVFDVRKGDAVCAHMPARNNLTEWIKVEDDGSLSEITHGKSVMCV